MLQSVCVSFCKIPQFPFNSFDLYKETSGETKGKKNTKKTPQNHIVELLPRRTVNFIIYLTFYNCGKPLLCEEGKNPDAEKTRGVSEQWTPAQKRGVLGPPLSSLETSPSAAVRFMVPSLPTSQSYDRVTGFCQWEFCDALCPCQMVSPSFLSFTQISHSLFSFPNRGDEVSVAKWTSQEVQVWKNQITAHKFGQIGNVDTVYVLRRRLHFFFQPFVVLSLAEFLRMDIPITLLRVKVKLYIGWCWLVSRGWFPEHVSQKLSTVFMILLIIKQGHPNASRSDSLMLLSLFT